jgi:hypothetical protein
MVDRQLTYSRMTAETRRRIAALALARTHRCALRADHDALLGLGRPRKHPDYRSTI